MQYMKYEHTIKDSDLSNNTYNTLIKKNTTNISSLFESSEHHLDTIKNMEVKSVSGILAEEKEYSHEYDDLNHPIEFEENILGIKIINNILSKFNIPIIYDKLCNLLKPIITNNNDKQVIFEEITLRLYGLDEVYKCLTAFIVNNIEISNEGLSEISLYRSLPYYLKNKNQFSYLLQELVQKKIIKKNNHGIYEST